jgi:hypothetical protein
MRPFDVDDFEPPGHDWRRRLGVLVMGSVAFVGALAVWPAQSAPTSDAGSSATSVAPTPAPTTTTTVSPQSIQAGVATLLAHEGATPQELASAPASARSAGGVRHSRAGGRTSRVR